MPKSNKDFFREKKEWSEIKDRLLGCYLTPYFQKVLCTGKPVFYVDCFAGKGKFDDGKDGSPRIALRIRDTALKSSRVKTQRIDTCFIDLNHTTELNANIADFNNSNGAIYFVSGKYEEEIKNVIAGKEGANVFLYIDPYGIKALDCSLFDDFFDYGFASIEMLINLNSFGFFRDACRAMRVSYINDEALNNLDDIIEYDPTPIDATPQSLQVLNDIAGGDYWQAIVNDYNAGNIDGYGAEQRFSTEYKARLKKKYTYVLDMPIRLKAGQRPKYRMIHVTNHEAGCFLMAENMQKRKDELFINVQQDGQYSIFDNAKTISTSMENEILTASEIAAKMKEHLMKFTDDIGITKLLATFVNEYGLLCEFKMIYDILNGFKSQGFIEIIRNPAFTPKTKQPSTFWDEKDGKSVLIRRCGA